MKLVSKKRGFEELRAARENFRLLVEGYEDRAEECSACTTPGACCLDAHFVNVRISRLEGEAIREVLDRSQANVRDKVYARIDRTIAEYGLGNGTNEKFACPLYEKGIGCLVHTDAKPLPCIQHACYERAEDLPPDAILEEAESAVDEINRRIYGKRNAMLPLPIAVRR